MAKREPDAAQAAPPKDPLIAGIENLERLQEKLSDQLHRQQTDRLEAEREKLRPNIERAKSVLPILEALKDQHASAIDRMAGYEWSLLRQFRVPGIDQVVNFVKEARVLLYNAPVSIRSALQMYDALDAAGIKDRLHLDIEVAVRDPESLRTHLNYCLENIRYRVAAIQEHIRTHRLEPTGPIPTLRPPAPPAQEQAERDFSVF